MMNADLREELMTQVNERVTVGWRCATEACMTGTVIGVSDQFVQVRGVVPTFAVSLSCSDGAAVQSEGLFWYIQAPYPLR